MPNVHGLPRDIPDSIKRQIRQRSKFGCVICRAGIFTYEHIDPEYSSALTHDPNDICCLCGSCHNKATIGQYSKQYVRKKYKEIDGADLSSVKPPFDYLDFHNGKAELQIGGISYDPGVKSVVRYHGCDISSVSPTDGSETAGINAIFLDDEGNQSLRIEDNVWEGALGLWDTEVIGSRIKVRKKKGSFALILRLEPPGRIVVERLDMRIKDAHILVSNVSYAIGRYIDASNIYWFHANMLHMGAPLTNASAIEFVSHYEAELRDQMWSGRGQRLASSDNLLVMQTGLGVANKPLGIIVGANCLKFGIAELATGGPRSLTNMRQAVFRKPDKVPKFIGTGVF